MRPLQERIAIAERHVSHGRDIIDRQSRLIARLRARGLDTTLPEELLAGFEHAQRNFEKDLERLRSFIPSSRGASVER